jgi:hypothetical protein
MDYTDNLVFFSQKQVEINREKKENNSCTLLGWLMQNGCAVYLKGEK